MKDNRRWIILSIFFTISLVFLIKLFSIQVLSKAYQMEADNNAIKKIITHPHRGLMYDRNGKLLITNRLMFSISVTPNEVKLKDTMAFCDLVNISKEEFIERMKKAMSASPNKPFLFLRQLSQEDFARIQDKLVDYKGFYPEFRTIRTYPHKSLAQVLGYIGEINKKGIEDDKLGQYRQGDFIGITGLEAAYEKELKGTLGVKFLMVDVAGSLKGAFKNGLYDTLAVAGKDLTLTIDLDLQQFGELLMTNKKGAIVMIEPATGEILCMITSPTYDPNQLIVGSTFAQNYNVLSTDKNSPMLNRAVAGYYSPGSVFKVVQALVGLQEKVLVPETRLSCDINLVHCHGHPSPANVHQSLQYSCNPYYFKVFRRIIYQNKISFKDGAYNELKDQNGDVGFNKWREYMFRFGLGDRIGIDLVHDRQGNIPTLAHYNKRFGEGNWEYKNIYSLGIGQGEMVVLPVQLANIAAILANKGFFYTPHLVKSIGKGGGKRPDYTKKRDVNIDQAHFDLVRAAMRDVVLAGTATSAHIPDIAVCGKTGTVQNPHGEDHSVFIAFAPMDKPKVAIVVYVENAGFGGEVAAPIARLMIERYLKGEKATRGKEQQIIYNQFYRNNPYQDAFYNYNYYSN